ncbi:hypothetical protein SAMN05216406_1863 [Nitrosomonas ureae]|uniref:Transposase n=1 Tax=Nitrosomonas ureae TaxID=44577 RepID=A0A1H2I163_9PROT|nr:hypothetical protein SAMN05216406_1863 [Nitrosomonas ureae]
MIGIDLTKEVFQIHEVDMHGKAVLREQLRRSEMVGSSSILSLA